MKDIDFDELDRAVNSLINNPSPASKAATVPVSQESSNSAPTAAPTPVASSTLPAPIASPSPAPKPTSGRFMDVVHPSSDMRATSALAKPTSREGMTIAPPEPNPTPVSTTTSLETPAPVATSSWPDPINLHEATNQEPKNPQTSGEDTEPKSQTTDDMAKSLGRDGFTPQESPFLNDAKVEKRPLGAFSTDSPAPVAETPPPMVTPAPEDSTPDDRSDHPIETDTPLPVELQDNLLSIEDDESPTTAVPTSITQQYTEQPSTGDQPAGAIFDADTYHKPLSHPKKNKSGWLVVLWIFVLLVVGAGAGVAVYFYVLPLF